MIFFNKTQFRLRNSTAAQKATYNVNEVYVLDTNIKNDDFKQLKVHKNALPMVMRWPDSLHYKHKGQYLPQPEQWIGSIQNSDADDEEFDFTTQSTITDFHPDKKTRYR